MEENSIKDIVKELRDSAGLEYLGEMPEGIYSAAADCIESLLAANAILLRKTELHECPWCGFYGTADGRHPDQGGAVDIDCPGGNLRDSLKQIKHSST